SLHGTHQLANIFTTETFLSNVALSIPGTWTNLGILGNSIDGAFLEIITDGMTLVGPPRKSCVAKITVNNKKSSNGRKTM
ncbi:hypothetical protein, partial [Stenotrophomonas maltophilia group sp. RNC7]|uniref:hypothetical protein n=1 Tax=Stenotrophomonas maltophilia group sp. RNC7 TaxID=3071467 RepID=UPI0027E1DD84